MLLRILNISRSHCNGARYTVVVACATLITTRKFRVTSNGEIIYIPRITMQPSDSDLPLTLKL